MLSRKGEVEIAGVKELPALTKQLHKRIKNDGSQLEFYTRANEKPQFDHLFDIDRISGTKQSMAHLRHSTYLEGILKFL